MENNINIDNTGKDNTPNKKSNKWKYIIIALIVIFTCIICSFCVFLFYTLMDSSSSYNYKSSNLELEYQSGDYFSNNKILVIPINGVILNEKPSGFISMLYSDVTFGYEIKDILVSASKDESIKGVILAIDSPGGTVTGSKAISDGVEYYREVTGNPVVSHILGVGASGGYWAAASADYIIADSGSLIGSIGVIFGPFKYYDGVYSESESGYSISTEDGITTYYITSGEYKDFGNPYREMSEAEKKIMQEDTDSVYNDFVEYISNRRNISKEIIKTSIKALPYGNDRSINLKLIDKTGPKEDSINYIVDKLGLMDYQVVNIYQEDDFWSLLFSSKYSGESLEANSQFIKNSLQNKMLYLYQMPSIY